MLEGLHRDLFTSTNLRRKKRSVIAFVDYFLFDQPRLSKWTLRGGESYFELPVDTHEIHHAYLMALGLFLWLCFCALKGIEMS